MSEFPFTESEVPQKKRRGWIFAVVIPAALVGLGVLAYNLSDSVFRQMAEDVVAGQVQARLPEGVTGDVDVSIGGGWIVAQFFSGRFAEVHVDAPELEVNGIPVAATVTLDDVPRDTSAEVGSIEAVVTVAAKDVAALDLVPAADGDVTLGDGTVGYSGTHSVYGLSLGYTVEATPSVSGSTVSLTPTSASVDAGALGIDVQPIIDTILHGNPIDICVADRLPAAVELEGLTVTAEGLTVRAGATNVALTGSGLGTVGHCE